MPVMAPVERMFCTAAPWRTFARATLPWALGGAALSGDVLEIGAGSGAMAGAVADRCPDVRLTVTDYDDAMVAVARRALGPRADVQQADATALPFADGTYDAVLSFLMLHHVGAWETALAECVRVLKPGGALVGYDAVDSLPNRVIHRVDRSPHRLASQRDISRVLASLPVRAVRLRPAWGGLLLRFHAIAA